MSVHTQPTQQSINLQYVTTAFLLPWHIEWHRVRRGRLGHLRLVLVAVLERGRDVVLHHRLVLVRARQRREDLADPADDLGCAKAQPAAGGRRLHLEALLVGALLEAAVDGERAPADVGAAGVGLRAEVLLDVLRVAVELRRGVQAVSGLRVGTRSPQTRIARGAAVDFHTSMTESAATINDVG